MPLYFFQITKNGKTVRPEESLELSDMKAAWEEATTACGEMIKELDGSLEAGTDWNIEIQDEFRNKLRELTVSAKSISR